MTTHRLAAMTAFSIAVLALSFGSAWSGTGQIRDGRVDLSVLFLYQEGDPDSWRPVFDEASELLYNATNGQLQLGRIRVYACSADHPDIDVWIQDNYSGAFANLLGLGGTGHIFLSQLHHSSTDPALGQFGLVHELGHYAFGLYDEYKGEIEAGAPLAEQMRHLAPNQFCVTDDNEIACVMDGGTIVLPNNHRTEFCTRVSDDFSTQHNAGVIVDAARFINAQEFYNHESCWETMARNAGLLMPQVVDPSNPPGLEPIDWQVVNGFDNLVLCLDRSASMYAPPRPIDLSREAALRIVDLLRAEKTIQEDGSPLTIPGENLSVISFALEADIDFPLQPIVDEATRDEARTIIENGERATLSREESDLGQALEAALGQVVQQSEVPACSESIVLLTDGRHTSSVPPLEVVPALVERGIRVYAIGVGDDVDEELLRTIATETHGEYFRLTVAEDLPGIFTAVAAAIRADGTAATHSGSASGDGEALPIIIDGFAEEFTAVLTWDEGVLDLVVVTPGGERIDISQADSREDIEAIRGDEFLYIRVVRPEEGTWIAEIRPQEPDVVSEFELTVLESDLSVSVTASTDREVYDYPNPVHLSVDVLAGVPVAGAEVTATVDRPGWPDPSSVTLEIFDDGDPAHGDLWANDGVYNAIFDDFAADGVYRFQIEVVNVDGTGPDPDLPFVEDGGSPPGSIAPFARTVETSILLQGQVEAVIGELVVNPTSINIQNHNGTVTCYLEIPEPFTPEDIEPSSIRLNGTVMPRSTHVGDADGDDRLDLKIKFDRGPVIDRLPLDIEASVNVSGRFSSGQPFVSGDIVGTFDPRADAAVVLDSPARIDDVVRLSWPPSPVEPLVYDGFLSLDGGTTWQRIFSGVAGTEHDWSVHQGPAVDARVMVQARSPERVVEQIVSVSFPISDAVSSAPEAPTTAFIGVSPSPIRDHATIRYQLASATQVDLSVYDVSGRMVRHLASGQQAAGPHSISWDGSDDSGRRLSSGVYWYVFAAGEIRSEGRMIIAR